MNNLSRNHSEDSGTSGEDCEKTTIQKLKFFVILFIPSFVWGAIIFNVLPSPDALTEFLESNRKDNMLFVMAPSYIWMCGGLFYGFKKGYIKKQVGFSSE